MIDPTTLSARDIIKREYGETSRNIVTPKILGYGMLGPNAAYELSTGTGMSGGQIWGLAVVVVNEDGSTARVTDDIGLFHSKSALDMHKRVLRRKYGRRKAE